MGNGIRMLFSIAIGAVVGVVTYLSSKSSTSKSQVSNNTNSNVSGGPANRNNSNGPNQSGCSSNRCSGGGFNNFRRSVSEMNNDGFVDFLLNSQVCLEKFLSILKSLALSLEYMSRIFSNQQSRKALPQYIY